MAGVAKYFNGNIFNKANEEVDLNARKYKRKIIGLYFSAHWCSPCLTFTPRLIEFYRAHAEEKKFEIIFLSSDYDEKSFYNYYQYMPWLRLDYRDRVKKQELEYRFGVNGIPRLILLDGGTGDVILADAREHIERLDPQGQYFPWSNVEREPSSCCSCSLM
ncbi:unnamed protein product [Adineta steineri]|uniref:Thioredoxin domain-containing protein n=1 Tax=Adineta steineri TaxID=433720 RepID=A0A818XK93_9BILA|nr:unnamed protein product [Adineta steineri]